MLYYLCAIMISINPKDFFLQPANRKHIHYEALRCRFVEQLADEEICRRFLLKVNTYRSLLRDFRKQLSSGMEPARLFFQLSKRGKREKSPDSMVQKVLSLRVNNMSVPDIKAILSSEGIHISFWKIDKIIKQNNLPRLNRRTLEAKNRIKIPDDFIPPPSVPLEFPLKEKFDSNNGSIFLFYPIIQSLQIDKLSMKAGYPQSTQIPRLEAILSYLALKLTDTKRIEHSNEYGLDRGLGLFSGLNVLPKNAWFSSYSYRISREMNRKFLAALHQKVKKMLPGSGDINLDFTTIPHWGDESVLENNWSAIRGKGMKSVLAVLAQDQQNRLLKYGNATIKHKDQSDAVLEFIDFYKKGKEKINCLIFDSKFTTYANLGKLNKDGILFITLRRRSSQRIEKILEANNDGWELIQLNKSFKRKHRRLWINEQLITSSEYDGELRKICIKSQARTQPTFMITNDMKISCKQAILKYARRWLIEQDISEQVEFFHLNRLNSSIVVKVDFDLTMSILAETVYRLFASQIPGFEQLKSDKIYRYFIKNYAHFDVSANAIKIRLNKKRHLPLLMEKEWFKKGFHVPWLDNAKVNFELGTSL